MDALKALKPLWVGVIWTGDYTDIMVVLQADKTYTPSPEGHWMHFEVGDVLEFANTIPTEDAAAIMIQRWPDWFERVPMEPPTEIVSAG